MPVPLTSSSTCCNNYGIKGESWHQIARYKLMGTHGKGDKSAIQKNNAFNSNVTMVASFLPVGLPVGRIVNKKNKQTEKYVFYCSVSQIHINR